MQMKQALLSSTSVTQFILDNFYSNFCDSIRIAGTCHVIYLRIIENLRFLRFDSSAYCCILTKDIEYYAVSIKEVSATLRVEEACHVNYDGNRKFEFLMFSTPKTAAM